jgi:tRNA threonylcarbamoyladenosine biosynthesis protein TsaE
MSPEGFLIEPAAGQVIESSDQLSAGSRSVIVSSSEEETFKAGERIGALLAPGSVVAMQGGMGSGKTYLAKGIASGLGIKETLTSPTYTIISEYRLNASANLYHIDAYRLNNDEDFNLIGGMELITADGISLIEWSERIQKSLPDNSIKITLTITGPSSRLIRIEGMQV